MILLLVFLSGSVVLVLDRRERKLMRQISLVETLDVRNPHLAQSRSIRRALSRYSRLHMTIRTIFCYDQGLSEAYSLPIPFVLVTGLLAGVVAGIFASLALPRSVCVLVGCILGGMAVRGMFAWQRARYANRLLNQMPDVLAFIGSAVRAGIPVVETFRGVTREVPEPTRSQFVKVMNEVALGRQIPDALLDMYRRTGVTEYAIFAVTIAVQTKSGGHLAETIETLAMTVRERITIAARARALAGEGKVSAMILSALPIVAGCGLSLIRPGYLDPLFEDPRGKRLFLIGVVSLLVGILMMRRMISRAVSE
jgi:tight adherence protein B